MKEIIRKLVERENLTREEAKNAMEKIMSGEATPTQISSFLTALRMKGETIDEITGCAEVMREKALRPKEIPPEIKEQPLADTCGTGGTGTDTFNISTAVAIVTAAAGVRVAKHGNRSASSKCGSADVLEHLGVKIDLGPEEVLKSIMEVGIGFIFAPRFHVAMKYAVGPRREIGIRTIFNILGPLTNPFSPNVQLLGVFDEKLVEPIAMALLKLGVRGGYVVYGYDRTDEVSITSRTKVAEIKPDGMKSYFVEPENFGLKKARMSDIEGIGVKENAEMLISLFRGEKGPRRDVVVLNTAFVLTAAKKSKDISEGIELACKVIDDGSALKKLDQMREFSSQ